jgi:hypothetical protein
MSEDLIEAILRPRPCLYCGARCGSGVDYRLEPQPNGVWVASCDKCNREHDHADFIMGLVKPIDPDGDECPF